jgi:uncharacterized protein
MSPTIQMRPPSESCEVSIRVTPRASRSKVESIGEQIKVWVTASPTDGRANAAVCELIAEKLKLPKSRVTISSGHTSRQKRLHIEGLPLQEVMNRLCGGSLF